jgi:hypothetical protein
VTLLVSKRLDHVDHQTDSPKIIMLVPTWIEYRSNTSNNSEVYNNNS